MSTSQKIILNHQLLLEKRNASRGRSEKIVFTNGCFDILHPGHTRYLAEAKKLGDRLIVAVNSDSSVGNTKGTGRPIQPEDARIEVVASLEAVDWVTIFDEETPYELIKFLLPDVLVKGGDWSIDKIVGADLVQNNGGTVKSIPITYKSSTTDIIDSIKNRRS